MFAEREAGFYTTRFGRSDPVMRDQEAATRLNHQVMRDQEAATRLNHQVMRDQEAATRLNHQVMRDKEADSQNRLPDLVFFSYFNF